MNLLQGKSNQYLRDAILEGSVEKARRYLTLKIGKADVAALTESGGFTMLHCACLVGNTQIAMMLLQYGADVLALTDDGYSALDLAIWKGHLQIIELLRSQGCVAPMKEPDSLNGKVISHLGRKATVVFFEPSTSIRTSSLRGLYYEDKGEAKLVNLWAGLDYKIVGSNPYFEELRKLDYQYAEIPVTLPEEYDAMLQGALQGAAFFDNDSDSESENEIEEVIEVRVPPGPLGVLLDSGIQECAVVHGFTNLGTGEKGPIELHGDVYPGMYIMSINEANASLMSLQQVTQLLGKLARKEKLIRFAVFRPGSPRNRSVKDTSSQFSDQRSSITSNVSLPPPVPAPAKPPTPNSTRASFSSRFANLAASVMDKRSSTSRTSFTSSAGAKTP
ncbi:FOG: Ankyrin repeat [Plasmopara halstedii]|uniref:FOG: Ankyrin repeat n=1 Tax=Plasmopara halstedii TaxID=4781 RepID=A0A0P1B3M2_PLAHL|nr:FOG: Ankyrin repeat [Plasmopara halstedii]CEG48878.1 FOG: Ankyrin repeat [Plasmopara halstedii]|eukprot:XP_024585247.1 FOG: Ankyrin repeat [Plasmopara halstedii]